MYEKTTLDDSLVPRRSLLIDFVFHVLPDLCRNGNECKIRLWVEPNRFQERCNLRANLIVPERISALDKSTYNSIIAHLPLSHWTVVSSILFTTTTSLLIPLFLINTACSLVCPSLSKPVSNSPFLADKT
jgi:hypothetical protein